MANFNTLHPDCSKYDPCILGYKYDCPAKLRPERIQKYATLAGKHLDDSPELAEAIADLIDRYVDSRPDGC